MNHIEQIKQVIVYAHKEAEVACVHHRYYAHLEEIASRLSAIVEQMEKVEHSDDEAVNSFCAAMKTKLARKRAEGRGGWETCDPNVLAKMLVEHIPKGDPVDIANFAMFLWHVGSGNELKEVSLATPQVPDGMVLVPKEPNADMIIAGNRAMGSAHSELHTVRGCYKSMIAAAKEEGSAS